MRLPGYKTLRQSARWLRSRFGRGALLLGYHRVTQAEFDPYTIRVSPQHFAEQLSVLRRWAHPMPLPQVLDGLKHGGLPARAVAVTFDDGYADVRDVAVPLLEQYSVPATVFVASGYLGREFWWDELARLLLRAGVSNPARTPQAVDGFAPVWADAALAALYRDLLARPAPDREARLADLRTAAGPRANGHSTGRCLSAEELVLLAAHPMIDIGAHSVTHPRLAAQPVPEQTWEVEASKSSLEALLGCPVTAFAYPNGSAAAATRAIVQEAGFRCACSSEPDVARPGSDPFALPRMWIPDWSGEAFGRWLRRWLSR